MHLLVKAEQKPTLKDKTMALKNKITSKVGNAIAAPYVKYKESQMRQSDKDYKWLKGQNDMKKSGIPQSPKDRAIMQGYKDKYSK